MTTDPALSELYRWLGDELVQPSQRMAALTVPSGSAKTRAGSLVPSEIPRLRELAANHPEGVARFLSKGRSRPVEANEVQAAVDELERALARPTELLQSLKALGSSSQSGPPLLFDGFDAVALPLRLEDSTFETKADWAAYAIRGGLTAARYHAGILDCGPLPAPTNGDAVYALNDDVRKIAIFSDFANGLVHTRYLARYFATSKYRCGIHLGDVYYAGSAREVRDYLERPLADAVDGGMELFLLTGNHEMYAKGVHWLDYIHRKRLHAPSVQRQEGAYFCLRIGNVQLVGADTAWSKDARLTSAHSAWVAERLERGRDEGRLNVLLTSNEPYTYGKRGTTRLHDDMAPFIRAGLVDLWFWGNTHYAALFESTDALPFVGACVGHGGYPYRFDADVSTTKSEGSPPDVWFESKGRYYLLDGVRPEVGNNGFCELTVNADGSLGLAYIDWTGARRCRATVARKNGRARISGLEAI